MRSSWCSERPDAGGQQNSVRLPLLDLGSSVPDAVSRKSGLVFRDLGHAELIDVWTDMRRFTDDRDADTRDEVWFVEHTPVFTLGMNADEQHLLDPGDIPVVKTDRGGQVTYHGPGQLVAYVLLDLKRRGWSVRCLVDELEAAVVQVVARYGVVASGSSEARGVYVGGAKLAALGLRVRRNCSYHGLALNVAMDLQPFARINPCGYSNLAVTQLLELCADTHIEDVKRDLESVLHARLA